MIRSNDATRRLLPGLLTVLLTVPLAVSEHFHEADHDGGAIHLEIPHGGHHNPAPELYERVTSAGPEAPPVHPAGTAPGIASGPVVRAAPIATKPLDHPARPPPTPHRSRAPPFGS